MSKALVSSPDIRGEGDSGAAASQSASPVHGTCLPKRKRGRPRKNPPVEALLAVAPRGSKANPTTPRSDDSFTLDFFGDGAPFYDDELSTLDEFERASQSLSMSADETGAIKRIDKASSTPCPVSPPRRKKVTRRRQIDPATCERDYSRDEVEFMNALNEYKRSSGRMFPTCSEILEVLRTLGYEKHENPAGDE